MAADWTGNKASCRAMIAINKDFNTNGREINDYYATEPLAVELLLREEEFCNKIWEPACGEGHMARVLKTRGFDIRATDLVFRGYGTGNIDFFHQLEEWDGDIITNPPYKYAAEFVEHSLRIITKGHKVAMFCKLTFLEGTKRWLTIYSRGELKSVYVATKRLQCGKNGNFNYQSGMVCYAWFVWQKGYKGEPVIRWINTPKTDKEENLFKEVLNE